MRTKKLDRDASKAPAAARAAVVTSIGIISTILGLLQLLCSGYVLLGGAMLLFMGVLPHHMRPVRHEEVNWGPIFFLGFPLAIFGLLYVVGGIGVVRRLNWGRIMTLVLAGFSGVAGILMIIVSRGRLGNVIFALTTLLFLAHCIMSFVVLLGSQNAAEVRVRQRERRVDSG